MEFQKTLREAVSYSGIGLHTGSMTTVTFKPAPPDTGIRFIRVDIKDSCEIPADINKVIGVVRGTNIGMGEVKIYTVEHILSALYGLGIDNVYIEINANEPPVGDGSALAFVQTLQKTQIIEQNAPKKYLVIKEPVWFNDEKTSIVAIPSEQFKISCTIEYTHPILKTQYASFVITPQIFVKEIASARTYCFDYEIETLKKQGLAKGGSLDNAVVIGEKGIHNKSLRFPDEFVRHKILDLLGDLYLLGQPLQAHIIAVRCGHPSNINFIQKLRKVVDLKPPSISMAKESQQVESQTEIPTISDEKVLMDINQIMDILPHRPPFLFVDKILSIEEDKKAIGVKNVSINEDFFRGHFPGHPVMPGVLVIEAMAQVAGILLLKKSENAGKLAYFMTIDGVKFRRTVVPGDQLIFEVELVKVKSKTGKVEGKAFVNGQLVAEANFMFSLVER